MILLVEPFYGGSHKYLCDLLVNHLRKERNEDVRIFSMSPKKWHWRMLVSAAHFSTVIPKDILVNDQTQNHIFFSAMLNVAELAGLRPDLVHQGTKKILYFHENQLEYPKSSPGAAESHGQRDFGLVYNQIISCFVVDIVAFNSSYNMHSFLTQIDRFLNKIPTQSRPKGIKSSCIKGKCVVLHVPVTAPLKLTDAGNMNVNATQRLDINKDEHRLHVIWAHRWEYDKGPEVLVATIKELCMVHHQCFALSVLGQHGSSTAFERSFNEARDDLASSCKGLELRHWGEIESREEFLSYLTTGDVAVSTAKHEFLGMSMLEAAFAGCFPLCPNRLSYPEIFPKVCLYATERQLVKQLKTLMQHPNVFRQRRKDAGLRQALQRFSWEALKPEWDKLFTCEA